MNRGIGGRSIVAAAVAAWSIAVPFPAWAGESKAAATMSLWLGYSFGIANTPFSGAESPDDEGNEPFMAAYSSLNTGRHVDVEARLALMNFGRIATILKAGSTAPAVARTPDSTQTAIVRRAILADLTIRLGIDRPRPGDTTSKVGVSFDVNSGFAFDAQGDETTGNGVVRVEDASSYLLAGPSIWARTSNQSILTADLYFGQSEIMTGVELFARKFDSDLLRVRPRLQFTIEGLSDFKGPLIVALWGDMGFSEEIGDTYALFIAWGIWGDPAE